MSNTTPNATGEETSAAVGIAPSSSVLSFSQQSSDSSSQGLNSQENPLQCSESMVSSGPSDDSQTGSQPTSGHGNILVQGPVKEGTALEASHAGAEAGSDKIASRSESTRASASTLSFTPQTNPADTAPAPASASNGFHYSPGFLATSNLSQLAELAANKSAMNQLPSNNTQLPAAQPLQPHVLGNQSRFILPSQGMPPSMFGAYPSGPLMHMQGQFPPAPPQVPPPFIKGSIIQLATGDLKRVEDLTTEDFIHSTRLCPDLKLETSTVVKIEDGSDSGSTHITFTINSSKTQVILNCPVEHPFFVYGQGWTSSRPEQSLTKYNLNCQHLKVGDVCIFLSPSNPIIPPGVALSSGPTTQVSGGNSTLTQSAPGVLSNAAKSPAVSNGTSQSATSVSVSYAQTMAGMTALPGNMPGVVVTSSMPLGIPAVYSGTFPPMQNIGQGKASSQSTTERSVPPTQPVQGVGNTSDGKPSDSLQSTAAVPGGFPLPGTSYYQPLAGTLMTAMPPGQTFVQGTVMPQGSVGNGLLVAAVGFVPGRPPAPFVQPGMLYGTASMEMLPKGADGKPEEYPQQKGRTDTQAELSQPDAKRAKGETEVK